MFNLSIISVERSLYTKLYTQYVEFDINRVYVYFEIHKGTSISTHGEKSLLHKLGKRQAYRHHSPVLRFAQDSWG